MSRRSDLTSSGANNVPLGSRGGGGSSSSSSGGSLSSLAAAAGGGGGSLLQPAYLTQAKEGGLPMPLPSADPAAVHQDAKRMQVRHMYTS